MPKAAANDLAEAIERIRRADPSRTIQSLAKGAGVATSAVVAVRNGDLTNRKADAPPASERARRGWAETLGRLVTYVNRELRAGADGAGKARAIDIKKVLSQFGLDPDDTEVARAMISVAEQAGDDGIVTDAVLKQIALRANNVQIGLVRWPPFFRWDQEPEKSWAYRYTRRLVGSVNPHWIMKPKIRDSFDDAVVQMGGGSSELDVVFGVYNTPFRRLRGLDFIDMPGLAIPLAIVVSGPQHVHTGIWADLLDSGSKLWGAGTFLTLPGEVGELFLKGPCQIERGRVKTAIIPDDASLQELPEEIIYQFEEIARRSAGPTLLCADRAFCTAVYDRARTMVRTSTEQTAKFCSTLELVPTDRLLSPRYNLGLAVRADSTRWSELLRDAQVTELFGNAIGQTAAAYVELLRDTNDEIEIVELVSALGQSRARRFVLLCYMEVLRQMRSEPLHDRAKLDGIIERHLPMMLGMQPDKQLQSPAELEMFELLIKQAGAVQ